MENLRRKSGSGRNEEIEWIKEISLGNGYPKNVVNAQIANKIAQFSTLKRFGTEKWPVYLRVPWISKPTTNLEREVKTAVASCYGSVSTRLIFTSKRMLPVACKDVLPTTHKSFVIYEYKCHCESRYAVRRANISTITGSHQATCSAMVKATIAPSTRFLPHRWCKRNDTTPDCDSATGHHLLENKQCVLNYDNKRFSILVPARIFFHLNLLERLKGCLYQDSAPGMMQTERVYLHS